MAAANSNATAEGIAKRVYDKLRDARPDLSKAPIQNAINFDDRNKLGAELSETVWFADEAGITYGGSDADLFALNSPVAGESKSVSLSGCEIVLRSQVTIKKLSNSRRQGEAAFESFWTRLMANMKNAIGKRCDISLMFGGDNIGVVSGTPSGTAGARAVTLTAASWLPLAYLGAKGARLDFYNAAGDTKRNATTDCVITSVVPPSTIGGTAVINITGLESEVNAIANTDQVFFKGAKDEECTGLTTIAGLASGESYLGVAVDDYPDLWSGNAVAVGGNLTFATIQQEIMKAQARGGGVSSYKLWLSHATWATLAENLDALRSIDSSYSAETTKFGTRKLSFYTGNATVELEPTLNMKQGEAVLMPMGQEVDVRRIGSSDVDFNIPGVGERYFYILPNDMGVEVRCYSDQATWTTDIRSFIHFTGITNTF